MFPRSKLKVTTLRERRTWVLGTATDSEETKAVHHMIRESFTRATARFRSTSSTSTFLPRYTEPKHQVFGRCLH